MMTFGVRGHDFGKMPAEELARAIAQKGYGCLQLALRKALSDVDGAPGKLSPGLARHVRDAFARHGVHIAVLGCYINPIHPDPAERRKELDRFKEHLRFARDFGCSIVGTETGSVRADGGFDAANAGEAALDDLIRSVAELVAEAEKFGTLVCIEAVHAHVVNTPRRMRRVLDVVASNNLQVIFDPVNLLDADSLPDQDRIIRESFQLFGDRMMVLHAKDLVIEAGQPRTVPPGQGRLDYPLLVDLMKATKPGIYTLLEDTRPEFLDGSRSFIEGLLAR